MARNPRKDEGVEYLGLRATERITDSETGRVFVNSGRPTGQHFLEQREAPRCHMTSILCSMAEGQMRHSGFADMTAVSSNPFPDGQPELD